MALKIETRGIEKRFGGVHALRGVSVGIEPGTVHALVGENGAGKSTLGKIIAGLIHPDEGTLTVNGAPAAFRSPADALRAGIAIVSQELMLVPELSLSDNVHLGIEGAFFPPRDERRSFAALAAEIDLDFPPDYRAGALRVADQQKLEIMRALARNADVIVMDEPTAALGEHDCERLQSIIRKLRERGKTIIYVSHFLAEVLAISDTITVLRDGQEVRTGPAAAETEESLVEAMLGRPLGLNFPAKAVSAASPASPVLEVNGISGRGTFADVSFSLRPGEILGIAGLVGSGRTEVARAIYGADPIEHGSMALGGEPYRPRSPAAAIAAGVALLPESRKDQGLLLQQTITDNIGLPHLRSYSRAGVLDRQRLQSGVGKVMSALGIKAESGRTVVGNLSGGNQQKVVLGRWILKAPRVLIADEPTRGVDVGAKATIYATLAALAAEGMAIIVISSELEELLGLAHRAVVMRGGRAVAMLGPDQLNEASVLKAAFGGAA